MLKAIATTPDTVLLHYDKYLVSPQGEMEISTLAGARAHLTQSSLCDECERFLTYGRGEEVGCLIAGLLMHKQAYKMCT